MMQPTSSSDKSQRQSEKLEGIGRLPDEIIEKVCQHLPAVDLLRASHVSSGWRKNLRGLIKSRCLEDGLELPKSGVRSYSGLLAHAEHSRKAWGKPFLAKGPTFCILSPCPDKSGHHFPRGAIQVTKGGLLSRGKENLLIGLPPQGSNETVRCSVLPLGDNSCMRLSNGDFLVVEGVWLHVFSSDCNVLKARARLHIGAYCMAECATKLATGHDDGIRFWELNTLKFICHLESNHDIREMESLSDGTLLLTRGCWGKSHLWDLMSRRTYDLEKYDYFRFDAKNSTIFGSSYFDAVIRYHNLSGVVISETFITGEYSCLAYSSFHKACVVIDHENFATVVEDDTQRAFSIPLDRRMNDIAVTGDGRWTAGLTDTGHVLLWDLNEDICHPSHPKSIVALPPHYDETPVRV